MSVSESIESEVDSRSLSLGTKLKNLRESRGYSIEDVAGQLYLDCSLISALESGDYRNMPSLTYVRGYIRNYIKLFDALSEFAEFENIRLDESDKKIPEIIPDSIIYKKKSAVTQYVNINYIYPVIIISFITILYYAEAQLNLKALLAGYFQSTKSTTPEIQYKTMNNSAEVNIDLRSKKTSIHSEKQNKALELNKNEPDLINLYYEHDSWTQVKDATGKKLISRFVKSGKNLNFRGKLPFTVTLGNSPAVKITVNGTKFNQSKYTIKEIAHFVINNKNMNLQQEIRNAENN